MTTFRLSAVAAALTAALALGAPGWLAPPAHAAVMARSPVSVRVPPFTPDSGSVAVYCGKLIDGTGAAPRDRVLVVIRDGRVMSVRDRARRRDATATYLPVLDLSSHTCLPGLVDMHTHLTDAPEDTADLTVYFRRRDDEALEKGRANAAATVLAGFTSVRNVGTYVIQWDTKLRDLINKGQTLGPRMQASGAYLTIPHGGGDLFVPDFQEPADNARFHAGVARGADQFRERAEALVDSGSDLLKVIASGAVLAHGGVPGAPEMRQDEIQAVTDIAHAVDRKVAAHAHGAESILMAIAAGADTIEHASYLDDAGIAAALKRGNVALSMDVYNGDYIDTEGRRMNWPEEFLRKNLETTEIQRQAFTRAVKAGVPIVYGTDAGVFPHGLNARQFPIMVARGMTPMQAIQSATSVRGDPLADIALLQDVEVVIKGGMILKMEGKGDMSN
jgi:imidazolonepropionase-like amidohydrolase